MAVLLAGCGGDEGEDAATGLQISGTPSTQAAVDKPYTFVPGAQDPDGGTLKFEIANRPSWLNFDPVTGTLQGTPTAANVGVYRGITIQVTDGSSFSTLPPFDISVVAAGTQSVTLSWLPPTQNEDGSPLTDLAGYRIRYGSASGSYTTTVSVANPGLATYVVEGLAPSKYFFVIASYNKSGVESINSPEASITL
jgi:hypothetical protein